MVSDSSKSFALAIQDIIHDLKTPLASISLSIDMLLNVGPVNDKQNELAEVALSHVRYMGDLIGTLLQVAWIDAALPLETGTYDLRDIILQAVGVVEPRASERGISLDVDLPSESVELVCDRQRLTQIVINLLSNAVKFNQDNASVSIELDATDDEVIIGVRDEGPGIAEVDRPHIFSRFYRSDSVKRANLEGTGLGLANARDMTARHGGRLWFDTTEGQGTTFYVALPRRASEIAVEGEPVHGEAPDSQVRDGDNQFMTPTGGEMSDGVDDNQQESYDTSQDEREVD